jgi:hypothetical protein
MLSVMKIRVVYRLSLQLLLEGARCRPVFVVSARGVENKYVSSLIYSY